MSISPSVGMLSFRRAIFDDGEKGQQEAPNRTAVNQISPDVEGCVRFARAR